MSFERAYLNCRECYYDCNPASNVVRLRSQDSAMDALEHSILEYSHERAQLPMVVEGDSVDVLLCLARDGLKICLNCNQKKANIANLVAEKIGKEKPTEITKY